MDAITHNNLPEAVTQLRSDVIEIKRLLLEKSNQPQPDTDRWLSLDELCDYLPGKPAKATIYGKVHLREIPHKKMGKRLAFLKSDIDTWLNSKGRKTIAETETAANEYLGKKKQRKIIG